MKKLSLLLLAICVTLAGATAGNDANAVYEFNPYAYDLTSTWNENTGKLTVNFKLNSAPNLDSDKGSRGMQIYAVDSKNNRYYILGPSEANIKAFGKGKGPYSFEIDLSSGYDKNGKQIPFNEDLTWEVTVAGRPSTISGYNSPRFWNWSTSSDDNYKFQKRFISQGIAINTNPQSPNFGRIYISDGIKVAKTDAYGEAHGNSFHSYAKGRGVYMLEPDFFTFGNNGNPSTIGNTDNRKNGFVDPLEPWRIRTTDDGRVFVSSYSKSSATAVWELTSNAPYYRNWNAVLNKSDIGNRRVIGMDVKGSGSQLTLLVLCQGSGKELKCYEINLGTSTQYNSSTHTLTEKKVPSNINFYEAGINGHAQVAYGNGGAIWYSFGIEAAASKLYRVKADGTTTSYSYGSNYGGEGFLIKNNLLIKGFRTGSNNSGIYIYGINNDNPSASASYTVPEANTIGTGAWITDFALDYANNLYAASSYYGRVMPISLPYSGTRTTRAQTKYNFRLKAVPNILATDLTYAPYGNENKYEFSFNVNTKPELAQIRFYANEADMLANNGNYSFYYEFSEAERKQGRMSVIFDAVGGTIGNDKLLNDPNGNGLRNLPRGEYYWNVYVKTRKSCSFAPIYTQPAVGASDYHRQHATVDNNPDNEGFGHIYVADHHNIAESNNRVHYVRAYTIGNATGNGKQDNQNNINDNTRYTTHWQVQSNNKVRYTRRPVVSPDGMVYIADEGANQKSAQPTWFKDPNTSTYGFDGAGLHVLDPSKQTNNADAVWEPNFSVPHGTTGNQEVTTGAYFLYKDGGWKLYRTNTYEEYTIHPAGDGTDYNYQNARWNNNGYRVYSITSTANGLVHSEYNDNSTTKGAFGPGDAGGQFSIVATEYGVWMCQHREKTVAEAPLVDGKPSLPDNKENIVLSFFDHSGVRRFTSYTYDNGNLTQKTSSPLQSTPGAGMAYQKRGGVEYLYLVNHAGNILEFKITGGATPTLTHTQTYVTGNGTKGVKYGAISSMNFDYAGNLVVTAGATYGVTNGVRDHQELVIYTMPYPNQENARAIPASEAFRLLPERVAHLDMGAAELELIIQGHEGHGCAIDLYRPLQGGEFNTICLPFTLDLPALPEGHPLKNATLKQYTGLNLNTVGGEKVLELVFTDVNDRRIIANKPYIIQPENDNGIPHIISFDGPLVLTSTIGGTIEKDVDGYSITHQGIVPFQYVEPKKDSNTGEILTLMLVADNRLAAMTRGGNMLGFRGYFQLNQPLPKGMRTRITTQKPVATNTTIVVDGKRVNVEKFIREGRVCVRVGDTLYNINGEVIGR